MSADPGSEAFTPMELWYEFASPYAYLAVSRIEGLIADRPIRIVWKPFLLGPIFKRRSSNPSPFQETGPDEARYRRRDIERHCQLYGLPLAWPSVYPRGSLLGARVALVAADEGWCGPFTRAVYRANFAEDRDIASEPVIAQILETLGRSPMSDIARANAPENKARLIARADEAIAKGIFGAPSFVIHGELFWGNDRLEQAIAWTP